MKTAPTLQIFKKPVKSFCDKLPDTAGGVFVGI